MGDVIEPSQESVKIELYVPRKVDEIWRSLGYDETDYQYDFLEGISLRFIDYEEIPIFEETVKLIEKECESLRHKP